MTKDKEHGGDINEHAEGGEGEFHTKADGPKKDFVPSKGLTTQGWLAANVVPCLFLHSVARQLRKGVERGRADLMPALLSDRG